MINGWSQPGIPHKGWTCIDLEDLEDLVGACAMCGTTIRFVHHMVHADVSCAVEAGCVCAGKMEENLRAARQRERKALNRAERRKRWTTRRWKRSWAGNERLSYRGFVLGVYRRKDRPDCWKARINGLFGGREYPSAEAAKRALFDLLTPTGDLPSGLALRAKESVR